jgi:outer membrane receptor protein involved in Fe transport
MRHANFQAGLQRLNRSILYAAAGSAGMIAATSAIAQDVKQDDVLEINTIIVTANKREQELRDVAGSVSAYTGEQLKALGAQSLSDYITRLPGVVFNDYQPGVSEVVIRGVAATTYHEQGQTVVGYYINEIPLSEPGWPIVIPDVDTFDLERVEVLRGPQGTLFGSASLGGLVNYIAKEADTSGFDAAIQTSAGSTRDSDDLNYGVKGMVNVPLAEGKFAVRVVGLERRDAGYADNIRTGQKDSNDLTTRGTRLSAVFTPSETTKLSWLTMYQDTDLQDQTYVVMPTLTRDTYIPEPHTTEMLINSLRLEQELGFANLTVLAARADKESRITFDYTANVLPAVRARGPVYSIGDAEAKSSNFEVRLSSLGESRVGWVVGAMYLKSDKDALDSTKQNGIASYLTANGLPGAVLAPNDSYDRYFSSREDKEMALFGEVTFNFTDSLSLAAGGRLFEAKSDNTVGRLVGVDFPSGYAYSENKKDDGFTPKVAFSWKPNQDFMLYTSYSEGFRVGGANPNPPQITPTASTYDSDSVKNYEFGVRSTLAGGILQLDATVFHIDWDDIQVRLFGPAPTYYAYVTNAGGAKIDGVEFTGTVRAGRHVEFQTNVSYNDARISAFVPDVYAPGGGYSKGTTLPGSSEWTVSNSLSFAFDNVAFDPHVLLTHRYLSAAPVSFTNVAEKGDYHLVDLRAGATFGKALGVTLFVNNVFDKYGILNWPFGDFNLPAASVTRPRTIGLTVDWSFE